MGRAGGERGKQGVNRVNETIPMGMYWVDDLH